MQGFKDDNTNQSGWDSINNYLQSDWGNSTNNYPQGDFTASGWGNNTNNYPQGDFTQQGWNNNSPAQSYTSQPQDTSNDYKKYCNGSFNDYNRAGTKNKSSSTKVYVNNSYFSSGYTIPVMDNCNSYSLVKNNPNAVFINNKGKLEKFIFILPFPVIVFCTIIGALVNGLNFGVLMFIIMAIPMLMVFAYIILNISILPIIRDKYKRKCCKLKLRGTVEDIRFSRTSKGKSRYTPIYKYSYNSIDYYLNGVSSNYENIKVGTEFDIYINPKKPQQHYIVMHEWSSFNFHIFISVAILVAVLISALSIFINTHFI